MGLLWLMMKDCHHSGQYGLIVIAGESDLRMVKMWLTLVGVDSKILP